MAFDIEMIKKVYAKFPERIQAAREVVGKPLLLLLLKKHPEKHQNYQAN